MFDFVLTPEMSKELLNYQGELLNNIISSIKKYFSENGETIANGLACMNGNFSGYMYRK